MDVSTKQKSLKKTENKGLLCIYEYNICTKKQTKKQKNIYNNLFSWLSCHLWFIFDLSLQ